MIEKSSAPPCKRPVRFQNNLIERNWKTEGLFAKAKAHYVLCKVKYHRLSKVQIHLYMTAMVQNFKRLVAHSHQLSLQLRHSLKIIYKYLNSLIKNNF